MGSPYTSRLEPALLSLLVPGAGHLLRGARVQAGLFFVGAALLAITGFLILVHRPETSISVPIACFLAATVIWLGALFTAARGIAAPGMNVHTLGALLNLFIPGVGHYLLHQWFTGLAIFLTASAMAVLYFLADLLRPGAPGMLQVWAQVGYIIVTALAVFSAAAGRDRPGSSRFRKLLIAALALSQGLRILFAAGFTFTVMPNNHMAPTLQPARLLPDQREHPSGSIGPGALLRRGEKVVPFYADQDGTIDPDHDAFPERFIFYIDERPYSIPADFTIHLRPGDTVHKGDLWASAVRKAADRVLLNRTAYQFGNPKRGDMVAVRTRNLDLPLPGTPPYLILRVVGLPGETISIYPPSIHADGSRISKPEILNEITSGKKGYSGFNVASPINFPVPIMTTTDDSVSLGDDEYFLTGDFPATAKDSRFFGAAKKHQFMGKVVRVVWPLDRAGF